MGSLKLPILRESQQLYTTKGRNKIISRKEGVAAALLKAYNGDDSCIFDSPRYHPNMHCYMTTLRELFFT